MYDLEAIIQYDMNELEAKAFKVALLWEEVSRKEFPNYQHARLRRKGDPRKSLLFKYCYKLVRETQGIIPDAEYRLYILAQLHILKNISTTNIHARIDPGILCGEKSWKRWNVWKRLYDQKKKEYEQETPVADKISSNPMIESELIRTKKFFFEKYDRDPNYQQIHQAMHDHTMIRWVTIDRVSPYYILLSPYVTRSLEGRGLESYFLFDLSVYRESITPEIEDIFRKVFVHEFTPDPTI